MLLLGDFWSPPKRILWNFIFLHKKCNQLGHTAATGEMLLRQSHMCKSKRKTSQPDEGKPPSLVNSFLFGKILYLYVLLS